MDWRQDFNTRVLSEGRLTQIPGSWGHRIVWTSAEATSAQVALFSAFWRMLQTSPKNSILHMTFSLFFLFFFLFFIFFLIPPLRFHKKQSHFKPEEQQRRAEHRAELYCASRLLFPLPFFFFLNFFFPYKPPLSPHFSRPASRAPQRCGSRAVQDVIPSAGRCQPSP